MFESGTKGYKRRVALRRTVQELKKVIASGEALKETYIERAKKAKAGNAPGSYRVARSGLKTTMMQVARAEQMLTSLELIIQHADFAKLSSSFIKGMNAASRELMRAAASMNFTKAERIFTKTLGRNEAVGIKTDAYLDTAADGFSFAALDAALDAEIDKVIGRFVEMDEEDEFRRKMNAGPVSQAVPQTDAEPASQAVPPSHSPRPQTPAAGGAGTGTSPAGSVPPAELSRPVKLYGAALRPKRLADFRGQPKIVKDLGYWIAAAKQKGEPLPHVMITGSRGLGKSTVAEIIAHETGADAPYELQGDTVKNTDVANAIFARVKRGDILYIDEIHLMPGEVQDSFLKAVDEYKYFVTTGRKPDLKTEARTLPPFTLIGATTDPARVKPALRERCAIQLKMEYYTPEVLAEIIKDMLAAIGGFTVSDENALELARRCRGNTRNARNHCKKLEAIALAKGTKTIDAAILGEIFEEDIDARGLGKPEIDYLKALIIKYGGGPVGVEVLASAIGEQKQNVIKDIEPYLHYLGMVNIAGGRVATEEAYKHLGVKKAEGGGAGAPDDGPESDY